MVRGEEGGFLLDDGEGAVGEVVGGEEGFFVAAVAADGLHRGGGGDTHRAERLRGLKNFGGHLFEFIGEHVQIAGEVGDRDWVGRVARDVTVGPAGGGVVGRFGENVGDVAHAAGGFAQHGAKLAAAEDADGGGREDGF